ncbi:MAG: hypothetical protein FWF81_07960, partial [Defluviitaleaceae bacterium]|nr:hypothetical protein [Defluviitaleaceae bacterium]
MPLLIFNYIVIAFIQDYFINARISEVRPLAVVMSDIVTTRYTFEGLQRSAPTVRQLQRRVGVLSSEIGVRIVVVDDTARV